MIYGRVKMLLENRIWSVATFGEDGPHVVPIGFKGITEDGKLYFGDLFMETTRKNIEENGYVAISAIDLEMVEAYQVKGTAEYLTEGPLIDEAQELADQMFDGARQIRGVVVVTPEKVIVTSPGENNNKEL